MPESQLLFWFVYTQKCKVERAGRYKSEGLVRFDAWKMQGRPLNRQTCTTNYAVKDRWHLIFFINNIY